MDADYESKLAAIAARIEEHFDPLSDLFHKLQQLVDAEPEKSPEFNHGCSVIGKLEAALAATVDGR